MSQATELPAKQSQPTSRIRRLPYEQWRAEAVQRFGECAKDWKFKCPHCGTVQSARDFYDAGFKPGTGEVNKYLGFSCIGRFTKTKVCDWTLGGLLQIHTLEVEQEGKFMPFFEFADPEPVAA